MRINDHTTQAYKPITKNPFEVLGTEDVLVTKKHLVFREKYIAWTDINIILLLSIEECDYGPGDDNIIDHELGSFSDDQFVLFVKFIDHLNKKPLIAKLDGWKPRKYRKLFNSILLVHKHANDIDKINHALLKKVIQPKKSELSKILTNYLQHQVYSKEENELKSKTVRLLTIYGVTDGIEKLTITIIRKVKFKKVLSRIMLLIVIIILLYGLIISFTDEDPFTFWESYP